MENIKIQKTGIEGIDLTLKGGLPAGRGVLVVGGPGSGKTILMGEFLYQGVTKYGQNGVFVTFEEHPEDIVRNFKSFGWQFEKLIKQKRINFVDLSPSFEEIEEISSIYNLSPILERIKFAVKKINAKRVVIDGIGFLYSKFSNLKMVRQVIYSIHDELKKMGVTSMVSSEKSTAEFSSDRVEEYVLDGVIELSKFDGQKQIMRYLKVSKLRGSSFRSGKVAYEINENGIVVFPKIPPTTLFQSPNFNKKEKFGIPELDKALGGGIPEGQAVLIAGNSGTGKTTLAMHFLKEGFRKKEKGMYVCLEETIPQVKHMAFEHGWNFDQLGKEGKLTFISSPLIDIYPDALLYNIVNEIEKRGHKRIIFDSVSSLESTMMNKNQVREFMIQLVKYCKSKSVTCVINYLISENFGLQKDQLFSVSSSELRLSSLVDGVIVLRHIEKEQRVSKILNILKLRGCDHRKEIFQYDIGRKGFRWEDSYSQMKLGEGLIK